MIRTLLAGMALVGGAALHSDAPQKTDVAPFKITIETIPNGWTARCDSSCGWTSLSFTCSNGCKAVVDFNGVYAGSAPQPGRTAFQFVLQRTANGMQVVAKNGTAWEKLGWSCPSGTNCRAVLTEMGVEVPGAVR